MTYLNHVVFIFLASLGNIWVTELNVIEQINIIGSVGVAHMGSVEIYPKWLAKVFTKRGIQ